MEKLVSFLVPCYNGQKTISRMLDSLLSQTYTKLEVIVVDDGSTDDSAVIIQDYAERFKEKGMILTYFYQENRGLGGAIDAGLKLFHGEYLCWIDVDDFLSPDSVEQRLRFLEEHQEYSVVTSNACIVNEDAVTVPVTFVAAKVSTNNDENQFWHMLNSNTIFCPGCHMVRVCDFLKVNPTRSIYPARRGQNWQLLLPVYYRFKRAFLDKPLFYYVVSANSMSRDNGDPNKELYRCNEHEEIITQTLSRIAMSDDDRKKAEWLVKTNYARKRLYIAGRIGLKDLAKEQFAILNECGAKTMKDRLQLLSAKSKLVRKLYRKFRKQ